MSAEITGRDDFIIAQALYEAIKALSALPEDARPASNITDIRELLLKRYGKFVSLVTARGMLAPLVEHLKETAAKMPPDLSWQEKFERLQAAHAEYHAQRSRAN
jgi:hypothetical protein